MEYPEFSTILFAMPSFRAGMGSAVDIGGVMTEYNESPNGMAADANAIRADWLAVGHDMRTAMEIVGQGVAAE